MLSPKFRLRASADIERTIRAGKRIQTPFAALYILAPSVVAHVRICCVAGKKVDTSAVVRHAVQRKLRAASAALPIQSDNPYDMVIVASNTLSRTMKIKEITSHLLHAITTTTS